MAGDDGKPCMGENRDTPATSAMREIFTKVLAFAG